MDAFLFFYLSVKKVIYQIWEAKSITVTNDAFIKALLGKSISCEELQTEAKGFSKEGGALYAVILDKTHADYCAKDSGKVMRDGNQVSSKQLFA